jgi:hypothetical protein
MRRLTVNELEQRRVEEEIARLTSVLVDLRKIHANLATDARVAFRRSGLPSFLRPQSC